MPRYRRTWLSLVEPLASDSGWNGIQKEIKVSLRNQIEVGPALRLGGWDYHSSICDLASIWAWSFLFQQLCLCYHSLLIGHRIAIEQQIDFFRLGTYHSYRDTASQYITVVVSFKEFGRLLNTVGFHHRWFAPLQWVPEVPLRPSGDRWTQKGRPRTASTVVCSHSEQGIFVLGVAVFFRKRTVKFRSTLVTRNRGRSKRGVFARAQLLKLCSYV